MKEINERKITQLTRHQPQLWQRRRVREQWISRKDYATSFHAKITMFPNPFSIMTQLFPYILTNDVLTHYPK